MIKFIEELSMVEILLLLMVLVGIFLLIRELNCWYWKINEVVERLDNLESKVVEQNNTLDSINIRLAYICEIGINVKMIQDKETFQERTEAIQDKEASQERKEAIQDKISSQGKCDIMQDMDILQ